MVFFFSRDTKFCSASFFLLKISNFLAQKILRFISSSPVEKLSQVHFEMVQTKNSETKIVSSLSLNFHESFLLEFNNWRKYFAEGWRLGSERQLSQLLPCTKWYVVCKKVALRHLRFFFWGLAVCKKKVNLKTCASLLLSCTSIRCDFFFWKRASLYIISLVLLTLETCKKRKIVVEWWFLL